jgi:hypothetical protein
MTQQFDETADPNTSAGMPNVIAVQRDHQRLKSQTIHEFHPNKKPIPVRRTLFS